MPRSQQSYFACDANVCLRSRFPLELVYRVFDNCLASGIEAIFGFALALLQRNEERLLQLKFDELVAFLNTQVIETYRVCSSLSGTQSLTPHVSYRTARIPTAPRTTRRTPSYPMPCGRV